MKEYKLLISHVDKDKEIALACVDALNIVVGEGDDRFKITPVYMESKTDGCISDFIEWSENAVYNCDGVLAIITENTTETKISADGIKANVKVIYNEISLAKAEYKDILILRKEGIVSFEAGYNLLLQNIKYEIFNNNSLNTAIENIVNDVILHAKRRFR